MSGNPYRRQGPPGSQGNQQGSTNNNYYRMNNSQYHHNNHGKPHNNQYMGHHGYGNSHHRGGHGYSRGGHYNNHNGYSNQYNGRHNSYTPHHNANSIGENEVNNNNMQYQSQYPQYSSSNVLYHKEYTNNPTVNTNFNKPNNTAINSTTSSEQPTTKPEQAFNSAKLFSSRRDNNSNPTSANSNSFFSKSKTLIAKEKKEDFIHEVEKKPLDLNSLQPMKRRKSVSQHKNEDSETLKNEVGHKKEIEAKSETKDKSSQQLELKETDQESKDTEVIVEKHDDFGIDVDEISNDINDNVKSDFKFETNHEEESNDKLEKTQIIESNKPEKMETSKDEGDIEDDIDDEDDPIIVRKRTETVDKDEESETDIEDSIPVPSRKAKRLHLMLQEATNSDEEAVVDVKNRSESTPHKLAKTRKGKDNSRSQSPKQRKSSRSGRDASGRTLLQRMCAKGNLDEVKRLIESKSDINCVDFAGISPLHEAALEGYYEIAKLLIDNGANINVQSGQMDKDTPLIDAVSNLHYDVVKLLLENGADPTLLNAEGNSALDALELAINELDDEDDENLKDSKKIGKLLNKYVKTFKKRNSVTTKAKDRKRINDSESGSEEVINSLGKYKGNDSNSLQERIRRNDVTFVLNYVSSTNGNKIPAESLLLASRLGFPDIASLLIAFGADINYKDKNGWTPLMHAVGKDHLEMVKLLLSNQADLSIVDKKGRNVLDILTEIGDTDTEEYKLLSSKIGASVIKLDKKNKKEVKNDSDDKEDSELIEPESEGDSSSEPDAESDLDFVNTSTRINDATDNVDFSEAVDVEIKHEEDDKGDEVAVDISVSKNITNYDIAIKKRDNSALDNGEEEIVHKKKKLTEEKLMDIRSPSPKTIPKMESIKPRKSASVESIEKANTPVDPTPEEIEAKRLKEIEAQKAREALEYQRNERKRLKQQEIAQKIDALEKARQEEKLKIERKMLEKRRKEEEEQNMLLKEQEMSKLKENMHQEIEKRKLIRSYYPYGLQNLKFDKDIEKNEIENYLPLYVFKMNDGEYLLDLQISIVLNIQNFNEKYPLLKKMKVKKSEKANIWNLFWPLIGSYKNYNLDSRSLNDQYKIEEGKFNELIVNWIERKDFEDIMNRVDGSEENDANLKYLKDLIVKDGKFSYCYVNLNDNENNEINEIKEEVSTSNSTSADYDTKNTSSLDDYIIDTQLSRRFGERARQTLKFMSKTLW